jgi:hypothetical protein
MKTYSSYNTDIQRVINNNLADNLTWGMELVNDSIRYLVSKYYLNERSYTDTTVSGQQFYNLPSQVKELTNLTVSIGGVLWQPIPCATRQRWDALNVVPFTQDFPSYFFVFNEQVGIYPKPASNGNTITMNYKTRVIDLSMADVTNTTSSQTMTFTNGSATITATGAVFVNWMIGQWIRSPFTTTSSTSGDNEWYQIDSITSSSVAVLKNKYQGSTVSGAAFTIGQVPILPEDYQDLPLYRMGIVYYTTRFPDPARAQLYQGLYDKGEEKLNAEFGQKTSSVVINDTDSSLINPNLFARNIG